jgi:hypothetical protein
MREALLGKLVLVLSQATVEELAAHYRFATRGPSGSAECAGRNAEAEMGLSDDETADYGPQDQGARSGKVETLTRRNAANKSPYVFRWTGRDWEVIFGGGRAFHLPNTLGGRYLNHFLHGPNEPISAFDLEVTILPEKGQARARNSIQPESDPQALREYRAALRRLRAEREEAQAAGDQEAMARLDSESAALESALQGAGQADTGERARSNVRLAIRAVLARLDKGGPEERRFAEHLRAHLSIGYECLYSAPPGQVWG